MFIPAPTVNWVLASGKCEFCARDQFIFVFGEIDYISVLVMSQLPKSIAPITSELSWRIDNDMIPSTGKIINILVK